MCMYVCTCFAVRVHVAEYSHHILLQAFVIERNRVSVEMRFYLLCIVNYMVAVDKATRNVF